MRRLFAILAAVAIVAAVITAESSASQRHLATRPVPVGAGPSQSQSRQVTSPAPSTTSPVAVPSVSVSVSASAVLGPVVPPAAFGMTVNGLGGGAAAPKAVGSVRLWDTGTRWDEIETRRGTYNWAPLDAAIARAKAAGIRDILYVMGSTPAWAASSLSSNDLYGSGTASYPKSDRYYLEYLQALITRYNGKPDGNGVVHGRITSYEVWNEANLPIFYRGSPAQLASLTAKAYALIKKAPAPRPLLTSPSWLLRSWSGANEAAWLGTMKALGWPFDVANIHGYPFATAGPDHRVTLLVAFEAALAEAGGRRAIWDTEVNIGDRRPNNPRRVYTGGLAAGYVARVYVDSLHYGIARTYWYSWDSHILGIDMVDSLGSATAGGVAYGVIMSWIAGRHWNGCTTVDQVGRCALSNAGGRKSTVIYTTGAPIRTIVPTGATAACTLDGKCRAIKPGTPLVANASPQYLIGG